MSENFAIVDVFRSRGGSRERLLKEERQREESNTNTPSNLGKGSFTPHDERFVVESLSNIRDLPNARYLLSFFLALFSFSLVARLTTAPADASILTSAQRIYFGLFFDVTKGERNIREKIRPFSFFLILASSV